VNLPTPHPSSSERERERATFIALLRRVVHNLDPETDALGEG
jgi:hypothetical protein